MRPIGPYGRAAEEAQATATNPVARACPWPALEVFPLTWCTFWWRDAECQQMPLRWCLADLLATSNCASNRPLIRRLSSSNMYRGNGFTPKHGESRW